MYRRARSKTFSCIGYLQFPIFSFPDFNFSQEVSPPVRVPHPRHRPHLMNQFRLAPRRLTPTVPFPQDRQRIRFAQPEPIPEHRRHVKRGVMPALPANRPRTFRDIPPRPLDDVQLHWEFQLAIGYSSPSPPFSISAFSLQPSAFSSAFSLFFL